MSQALAAAFEVCAKHLWVMIRGIFSRLTAAVEQFHRSRIDAKKPKPVLAPIHRSMTATDRRRMRREFWLRRYSSQRIGGGTRIKASGCNACNLSELTVPSRLRLVKWLELYKKGLTPQSRL